MGVRILPLITLAAMLAVTGTWAELPGNNVIVVFNNVTQSAVRTLGIQNQISTKIYALVHLAQYIALKNAEGYIGTNVEKIGRAAYAGHAVLNQLFPWRFSTHDAALAPFIKDLDILQISAAQQSARKLAARLIGTHLNDTLSDYSKFVPSPLGGPAGKYQFAPNQTFVLYPQLAYTRPFVIKNPGEFDLGPPNALSSTNYNKDLAEVFAYGVKNSTARTQYQTDTAYFWADGATTSAITGHFNTIAQRVLPYDTPLLRVAEIFAQANVAAFDASVAGWRVKYNYLFWRPITAIRQGDDIPANAAYVKGDWAPELATPPHPEYASGHQYSAAAIAHVVEAALGTDSVSYTIGTEYPGLAPRKFDSLSAAVNECGDSRVFGGVHFRYSSAIGTQIGRNVASNVLLYWRNAEFY